jgi:heat shock protein HslJ
MRKHWIISITGGIVFFFSGYLSNAQKVSNSQQPEKPALSADNSRSSLDWAGTYSGLLPCADCEGIQTVITLTKDLTYRIRTKYMGRKDAPVEKSGLFNWNKDGSQIELLGYKAGTMPVYYLVGEDKLIQLDMQGNRITGKLADNYILKKEKSPTISQEIAKNKETAMVGTKWLLVELHGQAVIKNKESKEAPYLQMSSDGRVAAYAGCNRILGGYELKDGFRIHFKGMASTMMACMDMKTEQVLNEVFKVVDNYSLKGKKMTLNKGRMAPLAVFEAEK